MLDWDTEPLLKGDLLWIETPRNSCGEVYDVQSYCEKAKKVGAFVVVDATFVFSEFMFRVLRMDLSNHRPLQYLLNMGPDLVLYF